MELKSRFLIYDLVPYKLALIGEYLDCCNNFAKPNLRRSILYKRKYGTTISDKMSCAAIRLRIYLNILLMTY